MKGDLSFGLSLMSHLGDGNLVVSPASVRSALGMLYEGAKGETAEQLSRVGILPEDDKTRLEEFWRLTDVINSPYSPFTISLANALWLDKNYLEALTK